MDKLSGLVLDAYDDPQGLVMREIYTTVREPPELLKESQALTADERDRLPDQAFALVLVDGDVELKKFAMTDKGNTVLSVEYFLKTAHKLPVEAQKIAAANLKAACEWYGLRPPEQLEKVAIGVGTMLVGGLVAPGAAATAGKRLQVVKGKDTVMSPAQMDEAARGGR